jgi:hypothetical protein
MSTKKLDWTETARGFQHQAPASGSVVGGPLAGASCCLMRIAPLFFTLIALGTSQAIAEPPSAGEIFGHQVLPILETKCLKCHQGDKTKGGLDLSSLVGIMKGGENGAAIVAGSSRESLIYQQVSDQLMPPEGNAPLTYEELQTIVRWIDSSTFPNPDQLAKQAVDSVHDRAKSLWSFQRVVRPDLPSVSNESKIASPVDRFILQKLEANGATFADRADHSVLIRRLSFDLVGYPPSPEELKSASFEALVERLLDSPQYGERWGRHWLDVAGWSESALHLTDAMRPGFWRYRDWVITAFNNDMPYDQFVREQLAGDELIEWRSAEQLDDAMLSKLTATGFLRCTPDATDNQFITQEEKMYFAQQSAVEVATKSLLGLTLNCVRCHDHKYDPITQEEYYGLISVFQPAFDPAKWLPGTVDKYAPGPVRVLPIEGRAQREAFEARMLELRRKNEVNVHWKHVVLPAKYRDRYVREHLKELPSDFHQEAISKALAIDDEQRTTGQSLLISDAFRHFGMEPTELTKHYAEMAVELKDLAGESEKLSKQGLQIGEVLWALWDVSNQPSPTRLLVRGDYKNPSREIPPGVLRALDNPESPWIYPPIEEASSTTGRRRAFAEWVTRPDHPLTTRVMVNRIWQYHFGTGLVATPDDFGTRGAKPTHPELLDWLADEFVKSGWSVKHIHRLILNSTTWQQSSTPRLAPAAQLLYGFPTRRLEAEVIRDSMLRVSGLIDWEMGGPSVGTKKMEDGSYDVNAKDRERYRRSVYLSSRRTAVPTFMVLFDAPQMDTNWPVRHDSAVASQALAMMNHPFVLECSATFADRISKAAPTVEKQIAFAFEEAYSRSPSDDERELFSAYVSRQSDVDSPTAWRTVAHAILASNEFLYVD